ncbi:hypothetical protein, partial [Paraburkholderia piptadeniae]|uniref:hypothetical protein n=1 Tax=Paraburkholderia piptadeniae TaxID=1701573 RepID=UPI001C489D9B
MERPIEFAASNLNDCSVKRKSWWPRAHWTSWSMLLITTLAVLMISIDGQILPAVLPSIKK